MFEPLAFAVMSVEMFSSDTVNVSALSLKTPFQVGAAAETGDTGAMLASRPTTAETAMRRMDFMDFMVLPVVL